MPRNSVRKRRVAAKSLHSMVPCDRSSGLTSGLFMTIDLLLATLSVLIALFAQRGVEQLRRAVLDLPPVAVAVDEIERIGAMAEARLLHAAETEVLLPRVDLLERVIDCSLARDEHAPVVEHLLRRLNCCHLARLQHPIGLARKRPARLVPLLAHEQRSGLRLRTFES